MQALYRNSFGHVGDVVYLVMASLWLSRHMVLRCLCTRDCSTSRSVSLLGVLTHWISSTVFAGQYFDLPVPSAMARSLGISYVDDASNQGMKEQPSLAFTLHYCKTMLWYPVLRWRNFLLSYVGSLFGRPNADENLVNPSYRQEASTSNRRDSSPPISSYFWNQQMTHFWMKHGLSLQFCAVSTTLISLVWILLGTSRNPARPNPLAMQVPPKGDGYSNKDVDARGVYQMIDPPTWQRMGLLIVFGGTITSIVLYGRITFPFPDLVAGANVLKDVRNEARTGASSGGVSFVACMYKATPSLTTSCPEVLQVKRQQGSTGFPMVRAVQVYCQ